MSYGTDPAPNGDQAPYGDPNQFGPMSLAPDAARYLVGGPGWSGAGPVAVGMMSCPCP